MVRISGLPLSNSHQDTETLSPTACKELIPDSNYVSMEGDPSPVEPSDETPALANTLTAAL